MAATGGADGSIIIDVLLNTNQLDRTIRVTEGEVKSRFGKMGDSIKSFGKAVAIGTAALVGLGAAAIALAKPFVEAAGAAQALAAQFSTVFGELEETATKSLNAIAKETGIMPERLKGAFVQMAAFAKSSGVDTAGALDLTSRATLAAADSAAFYDRSIESVTESLQSFLKGNFENDSALGISATETTRNAAANKLYGKSFIDLAEDQKQLTLLQMVEDGNKLTGALGQAARETDGYENVIGNLKQSFENLKVAIGNLFFDQAINGLKAFTAVLQSVDVNAIVNKIKIAWGAFMNFISPVTAMAIEVIDRLKAYWSENGEALLASVLSVLGRVWEGTKNTLTEVWGFLERTIKLIVELWEENGDTIIKSVEMVYGWIRDYIVPIVQDIADFIGQMLDKILTFFEEDGQAIMNVIKNVVAIIMGIIDFAMPAIIWVIEFALENIKKVINGALDVIIGVVRIFSGLLNGDFSKMWSGVRQLFSGAVEALLGIMNLSLFGSIRTIIANLAKWVASNIKAMWDNIVSIFVAMVKSPVTYVAAMVAELLSKLNQLVLDAVAYMKDLANKMVDAIKDLPGKFLQVGKDIGQGLIDGIKSLNPVKYVKNLAGDMVDGAKGILKIFSPSRVFRSIGNDTMRGWIIGMEDYEDEAPKALIDSMGFEDVVKNGASVLDLMGNINGLGSNYTIGVGGLLTPMSVGAATGYSNNVTNNNGNTSSIVINGQTDVNEIERLQRRMQFGF